MRPLCDQGHTHSWPSLRSAREKHSLAGPYHAPTSYREAGPCLAQVMILDGGPGVAGHPLLQRGYARFTVHMTPEQTPCGFGGRAQG